MAEFQLSVETVDGLLKTINVSGEEKSLNLFSLLLTRYKGCYAHLSHCDGCKVPLDSRISTKNQIYGSPRREKDTLFYGYKICNVFVCEDCFVAIRSKIQEKMYLSKNDLIRWNALVVDDYLKLNRIRETQALRDTKERTRRAALPKPTKYLNLYKNMILTAYNLNSWVECTDLRKTINNYLYSILIILYNLYKFYIFLQSIIKNLILLL